MVQRVLETVKGSSIEVFIVWTPAIPGDDYERARNSTALIADPRARHYWDGSQTVGEAFAPVLGIRARMAWDVYLLFDTSSRWEGNPPSPARWLHQMVNEDPEKELTEERLESILRELSPPKR